MKLSSVYYAAVIYYHSIVSLSWTTFLQLVEKNVSYDYFIYTLDSKWGYKMKIEPFETDSSIAKLKYAVCICSVAIQSICNAQS